MTKPLFHILLISLLLIQTQTAPNPNPNPNPNPPTLAHKELNKYGFPIGLLPTNINKYNLNQTTGEFTLTLTQLCKITLPPDNYLATYSKTIRGKIVNHAISNLVGIRVWAFFKWWSITGIQSNGPDLIFEVGPLTAKYPTVKFLTSLDCDGLRASS